LLIQPAQCVDGRVPTVSQHGDVSNPLCGPAGREPLATCCHPSLAEAPGGRLTQLGSCDEAADAVEQPVLSVQRCRLKQAPDGPEQGDAPDHQLPHLRAYSSNHSCNSPFSALPGSRDERASAPTSKSDAKFNMSVAVSPPSTC